MHSMCPNLPFCHSFVSVLVRPLIGSSETGGIEHLQSDIDVSRMYQQDMLDQDISEKHDIYLRLFRYLNVVVIERNMSRNNSLNILSWQLFEILSCGKSGWDVKTEIVPLLMWAVSHFDIQLYQKLIQMSSGIITNALC